MKICFENWKCPNFDGSQLSCVTWYHKILSACSLGCKSVLIFTWNPLNFHNRHHITLHVHLPLNWQFWWFWTIWTAFLCQIWSFSVTSPKQKLIYRSLEAELQWNKSNIATKITIDYHLASKSKKNLLLRDRKPLTLALVGYSRLDPNNKSLYKCWFHISPNLCGLPECFGPTFAILAGEKYLI